jgi:hypothetical protein
VVIVVEDGTEVVVGRVDARRADLGVVDALARLQLAAGRRRWRVCLLEVSRELGELLELTGLADVLGVEPRRKAEVGEELGVEEVVKPGDLPV